MTGLSKQERKDLVEKVKRNGEGLQDLLRRVRALLEANPEPEGEDIVALETDFDGFAEELAED